MKTLVDFLKNNPAALSRYVMVGTALVDRVVAPLNKFMAHLLVVQGIDPKTQPGDASRQALEAAFSETPDLEEFDKDCDSAWLKKCFNRAQSQLKTLHLSQEKFKEMTDLSKVPDKQTPLQVAVNKAMETQTPWTPESQQPPCYTTADQEIFARIVKEREALEAKVKSPSIFTPSGELNETSLKGALRTLEKYAAKLESETPPSYTIARSPAVIGRGRKFPATSKVVKTFKNGLFRRVEDKKD